MLIKCILHTVFFIFTLVIYNAPASAALPAPIGLQYTTKWSGGYIDKIQVDSSGNIWIMDTRGKVGKWNGNAWTDLGTPNAGVTSAGAILIDSGNMLWAAGNNGTVYKWTGSAWSNKGQPFGATDTINALYQDSAGQIWAGTLTTTSISVYNGSSWSSKGTAKCGTTYSYSVKQFAEDSLSNIWVVASSNAPGCISKWTGSAWQGSQSAIANNRYNSIGAFGNGQIFAAGAYYAGSGDYQGKYAVYSTSTWTEYDVSMFDNFVGVLKLSTGNFIVGHNADSGNNGLFTFDGTQLSYYFELPKGLNMEALALGPSDTVYIGDASSRQIVAKLVTTTITSDADFNAKVSTEVNNALAANTTISNMQANITNLQNSLNTTNTNLSNLTNRVTNTENANAVQDNNITNLQNSLNATNTNLTNLTARVTNTENKNASQDTTILNNTNKITNLEQFVTNLRIDVDNMMDNLDLAPPNVKIRTYITGQVAAKVTGGINFKFYGSDNKSAFTALQYRVNSGTWTAMPSNGTITLLVIQGPNSFDFEVKDEAGNVTPVTFDNIIWGLP